MRDRPGLNVFAPELNMGQVELGCGSTGQGFCTRDRPGLNVFAPKLSTGAPKLNLGVVRLGKDFAPEVRAGAPELN